MALVINDSVSIAANSSNQDVLKDYRNSVIDRSFRRGGAVSLYLTASATGLYCESFVDQRPSLERSLVNANNRVPIIPDDLMIDRIAAVPLERVRLKAENTTGAAITLYFRMVAEPV
ncbi:MAG TPA: hypothetical protein VKA67_02230 [Verrucomicrobiae bacterium]|nr:hypothetical protein [Verrucomicrobiae bacterium]